MELSLGSFVPPRNAYLFRLGAMQLPLLYPGVSPRIFEWGTNRRQVANLPPKYPKNRKRHRIWATSFSNLGERPLLNISQEGTRPLRPSPAFDAHDCPLVGLARTTWVWSWGRVARCWPPGPRPCPPEWGRSSAAARRPSIPPAARLQSAAWTNGENILSPRALWNVQCGWDVFLIFIKQPNQVRMLYVHAYVTAFRVRQIRTLKVRVRTKKCRRIPMSTF